MMNGWHSYRAWAICFHIENKLELFKKVYKFRKTNKFDIESLANFIRTECFPKGVIGSIDLEDLSCKDWQELCDHWNGSNFK